MIFNCKLLLWILLSMLSSFLTNKAMAQECIHGLWVVENVMVGSEEMTPIGRWSRIKQDGTYATGNGWIQNEIGHYDYSTEKQTVQFVDSFGITDQMEPFQITCSQNKMTWERTEMGQLVKVNLNRAEQLPKTYVDLMIGRWLLTNTNSDLYKKESSYFFRWDRIIVIRQNESERQTGYWHANAHRNRITLLPHSEGKEAESWSVAVNEKSLTLTGASESNKGIELVFVRQKG